MKPNAEPYELVYTVKQEDVQPVAGRQRGPARRGDESHAVGILGQATANSDSFPNIAGLSSVRPNKALLVVPAPDQ